MAGTLEIPAEGSPNTSEDPKVKAAIKAYNETLNASNKLEASSLAAGALGRWYTPVEIATEQERENVAFGTLTTADEVKSVVLPTGGLIAVSYMAKWSSSVAGAGFAAIFLNAVQLKSTTIASVQEAQTSGSEVGPLASVGYGLAAAGGTAALPTTGAPISAGAGLAGLCHVFAAAGTYNVSIQFKATSGKVKVKERTLRVGVIGV